MSGSRLSALVTSMLLVIGMLVASFNNVMAKSVPPLAGGPLVLTDEQGEYPLGLHLEYLEDPSTKLTIQDVSSSGYETEFIPSQDPVPVFGFTNSVYWARIKIDNETRDTHEWFLDVLYSNLQFVDLYTPQPNSGEFAVKQSGSARGPATRDLRYPRVVFSLVLPPQSQETIYMRFQSGTSMTLNLTLWSQIAFVNRSIQEQIGFGLFFGVLIGLLFYNLFLLFSWKETSHIYFVILLASMILHEASYNGYLETYIIPGFFAYKIYYHPLLFSLLIVSMLLFADSFLEFKKRSPKLHLVTLVSVASCGVLVLLVPFLSYRNIALLLLYWAFISLLGILTFGIINYTRGKFRPAPLFMLAWSSLVVLILDLLLVRLGARESTLFSENFYRLGILLVAILWSISLADRVNLLKEETENANQALHKSEQKLSQILDGMPLGVALYTGDHKPKYANRSWFELLTDAARNIRPDLSAERTVAEAIQYYSLRIAGSSDLYPIENFPPYRALKGVSAYVDDIEMKKGDQNVPFEMWASPIIAESGEVESAVVVLQEISQRKMAEEILRDYHRQLESLVQERTGEVNAANKELRLRLEWLAAVNFVNQMIARSEEFSQIYEKIVEIINQLFSVQNSFIAELDQESGQLKILAHSAGKLQPELIGSSLTVPNDVHLDAPLEPGKAFLIPSNSISELGEPLGVHAQESELQNIAFIALQVREKVVGFLGLEVHEQGRTITSEESYLLSIFSTDIAQLLEDARLFEQAKLLVAAEERNRLARELHDSVAQTLYSISLFINATRLALQTHKPKVVESHLKELTQLSREAMTDMRLLIFELRPPILDKSGLAAALQSRLESVEAKAGFETHFESEGTFHFTSAEESELYRIAQEALNNVIKHAQASHVTIRLVGESGCIRMTIEDDGVGFDPAAAERGGGQGFRNMRERAANIGATCSFESVAGQGTKITIEVNE